MHAFCLMTNHVHLAVQMDPQPLSKGQQILSLRYTRHVNRSQGRVGHLFQARYKALLVDADSHGLELVRYIDLNAVRARLVSDPAHYPYSGHLGYLANAHMAFWPLTGCCRSLTRASA
jgi:REP element-mobilizing transposase RayT